MATCRRRRTAPAPDAAFRAKIRSSRFSRSRRSNTIRRPEPSPRGRSAAPAPGLSARDPLSRPCTRPPSSLSNPFDGRTTTRSTPPLPSPRSRPIRRPLQLRPQYELRLPFPVLEPIHPSRGPASPRAGRNEEPHVPAGSDRRGVHQDNRTSSGSPPHHPERGGPIGPQRSERRARLRESSFRLSARVRRQCSAPRGPPAGDGLAIDSLSRSVLSAQAAPGHHSPPFARPARRLSAVRRPPRRGRAGPRPGGRERGAGVAPRGRHAESVGPPAARARLRQPAPANAPRTHHRDRSSQDRDPDRQPHAVETGADPRDLAPAARQPHPEATRRLSVRGQNLRRAKPAEPGQAARRRAARMTW